MNLSLHPGLTAERWQALPWDKKILNIASELSRARSAMKEERIGHFRNSLARSLELIDAASNVFPKDKSHGFLREFLRLREAVSLLYEKPSADLDEFAMLIRGLLDLDPVVHNLKIEI